MPPVVVQPEKIDFVILYNDLIDYFIVCFEHQCVHFKKQLNILGVDVIGVVL